MKQVFLVDGPHAGTFTDVSDDASSVALPWDDEEDAIVWYKPSGITEASAEVWCVDE